MKGSSFKYLLKEGIRNVWSNRVMSFTSIGVLTTCLIIVGAAYLITANVNNMVGYVGSQNEMVVFLKDVANEQREQQKASVEAEIKKIQNIRSLEFVSKEQALQNTKQSLGKDGHLLDGLEQRNTFPDSFVIKVKEVSLAKGTAQSLKKINEIEIVKAADEVAETMTYIQKTVSTFGSILIIALAVISLFIISNTIRATIFARRKEINIMKFVGATNSFIRIPFVIEGLVLGVISAVIAFLLIWGSYSYMLISFQTKATIDIRVALQNMIAFKSIALDIITFFLVTGAVLGMLGSAISVRKHARV